MALFPTDFGRKFKRYVQIADQNLGRAEKSEVLTDQVQGMEKQMDLIRQAFQGAIKRLQACLPPPADPEKRLDNPSRDPCPVEVRDRLLGRPERGDRVLLRRVLLWRRKLLRQRIRRARRKLPESFFSANLIESAGLLSQTHHVFPTVFSRLGEAEKSLAETLIQYTLNVEKNVIEPLNSVVDKDIPMIIKLRKELTKATLDMDSAKKAYGTLQKQGQVQPGKIDSARDGVDAEEVKVDQCRDQLVTEMYLFFAREEKLCKWLLSVLQHQADYHRRSIEILDQQIAQMSEEIEQKTVKPVYGCDLKEHLNNTMKDIATVIEVCVQSIEKQGLDTEGLFRIAPSASKLRKLTAAFDANIDDVDWEDIDAHCLAGALKLYLRELPEPLMTFELYNDWSSAAQRTGPDKLDALLDVVRKLPKANYDNLKYLIQFMARVTEQSDSNKMSASNLAIVIAPNLLYPSKADQGGVKVAGVAMTAVEPLITNANWFFSEQRSASFSQVDLNQIVHDGEENKGSANVHKPLQRGHNMGLPKAKKVAPAPPLGHIGKQRSESAPEYQQGFDSADLTPRHFDPEKPKSAQPYERTVLLLGKPTMPPPLPPKKSVNEQHVDDLGLVENSTSFEFKDMTDNSNSHAIGVNPLYATNRTFQALDGDSVDGRSLDGAIEDDGSSNLEVFSPLGSCSSPDAEDSTSGINSEDIGESSEPMTTTQTSIAPVNSTTVAADLQKLPAIRVNENRVEMEPTDKTSSCPSLQSPRSPQKKPYDELITTSCSPPSPLLNVLRKKPIDISNKSASLPTQKKLPVELCWITPRSESTDNPDAFLPPKSKDVPVETAKVRPKAPPRIPLKDTKAKVVVESPRNVPEETTHL